MSFAGAKQRQRAAQRDQRGRSKECGAVLQRRDDLAVHHAHIARQHALHPQPAVAMHQAVEAVLAARGQLDHEGIAEPGGEKPDERDQVNGREQRHGVSPELL
jgi:hypothetical protein